MRLLGSALLCVFLTGDATSGPKSNVERTSLRATSSPRTSNASSASGECKDQSFLEHILDKLAFTLFVDPPTPAELDITKINVEDMVRNAASKFKDRALDESTTERMKAAAAPLQGWLNAVARAQAAGNMTMHSSKDDDTSGIKKHMPQLKEKPLPNHAAALPKGKMLPTPCASGLPADDPYWSQTDSYESCKGGWCNAYVSCRYSDGCKKKFTNLQRVNSIRATVQTTHLFFKQQKVTYMLFGGSVIGSYRCQDVLPWDLDADVAVVQAHFAKLMKLLDEPDGTGFRKVGRSTDMKRFGFPGFTLMEKHPGCMPLVVVDQATGFFTDVWPMEHIGFSFFSPWGDGAVQCNAEFFFNGCGVDRCDEWSAKNTLPTSKCILNNKEQECARHLKPFLYEYYGPSVEKPDVPTRGSFVEKAATVRLHR